MRVAVPGRAWKTSLYPLQGVPGIELQNKDPCPEEVHPAAEPYRQRHHNVLVEQHKEGQRQAGGATSSAGALMPLQENQLGVGWGPGLALPDAGLWYQAIPASSSVWYAPCPLQSKAAASPLEEGESMPEVEEDNGLAYANAP